MPIQWSAGGATPPGWAGRARKREEPMPGDTEPVAPSTPDDPGTDIGYPVDPWTEDLPTPPTPTPTDTDPVRTAVLDAYKKKGLSPRDDADLNYWLNKISGNGGWGNEENKAYWLDRMAMQYGGVGDYSESGKVGNPGNYRVENGWGVDGVPLDLWGSQYNDPYTQQLEEFIKFRLQELYQPVNDPFRTQYAKLLQGRTDDLAANDGAVKQLLDYLQGRFTDLQTPGRTGAEQEVVNTQAIEPLQLERAAAKRKVVEQLAARGITQDSGIFQEALLEVDRVFDSALASTRSGLTADELARREARSQEAGQVGASLVDIRDARSREALGTAQQLSNLSGSVRGEEESRRNQALSLVGFLANLGPERMLQAMAAMGMTGATPSNSLSALLQIAGLNSQNTAQNNQSSASFWSGLGSIAALMGKQGGMEAVPSGGTTNNVGVTYPNA